jgi:lipopolysaccharide transport system ATP-binding protein
MSSDHAGAVRIEGLSKRYRLGAMRGAFSYGSLRDTIADAAAASWRKLSNGLPGSDREPPSSRPWIWALKDVSFGVDAGEVVGIIGRNGAGKSTLLKILSRVTRPTAGFAEFRGHLASLLEVGTGFHPELTGRDNIYLNGAILGMRRAEIRRKFDDIVDFSGVSAFIDTPVKRYSSGMYVRLAFAVAAHLDPHILVVDEVLAVGDAAFQKQCLGKMQEVGRAGRTVLFVSHNMPAVTRLCDRAILLADGGVVEDGPAEQVVAHYLTSALGTAARREWTADSAAGPGNDWVRLRSVRVVDERGETVDTIDVRRRVGIEIAFDVCRRELPLVPGIALANEQGAAVFSAMDTNPMWRDACDPGGYTSTAWIPGNLLNEGTIVVSVALGTFTAGGKTIKQASANDAVMFQVIDPGEGGTARGDYPGTWTAPVRPLLDWAVNVTRSDAA